MCPVGPPDHRFGVDYYVHDPASPAMTVALAPGESMDATQASFARTVFANQPLDLAAAILTDFVKGFRPVRVDDVNDVPVERWFFQTSYPYFGMQDRVDARAFQFGGVAIGVNRPLAQLLRGYQLTVGYTPGPLLALGLLAGLLGGFGIGNARRSGIRAASLLVSGLGVTVLMTAAAFEFSWRYQLPDWCCCRSRGRWVLPPSPVRCAGRDHGASSIRRCSRTPMQWMQRRCVSSPGPKAR